MNFFGVILDSHVFPHSHFGKKKKEKKGQTKGAVKDHSAGPPTGKAEETEGISDCWRDQLGFRPAPQESRGKKEKRGSDGQLCV